MHCKCLRGSGGVCRFSVQFLWKRTVRIAKKPYTPQRKRLCTYFVGKPCNIYGLWGKLEPSHINAKKIEKKNQLIKLGIQTYKFLKNDDVVFILSFSSILLAVGKLHDHVQLFPSFLCNFSARLLGNKVIYPKYSKHWHYTMAYSTDCVCSKMLNHGLVLSLFKLIPIHWIVYVLVYLNFTFEF